MNDIKPPNPSLLALVLTGAVTIGVACDSQVEPAPLEVERASEHELAGELSSESVTATFEARRHSEGVGLRVSFDDGVEVQLAPGSDELTIDGVSLVDASTQPEAMRTAAAFYRGPYDEALVELADELDAEITSGDAARPLAEDLSLASRMIAGDHAGAEDGSDVAFREWYDPLCPEYMTEPFCDALYDACLIDASQPFAGITPHECLQIYNGCWTIGWLCGHIEAV